MYFIAFLFLLAVLDPIIAKSIKSNNGCTINLKRGLDKKNPPMILKLSKNVSYDYPSYIDPANLHIAKNDEIAIFCPGKTSRDGSSVIESAILHYQNDPLKPLTEPEPIVCDSSQHLRLAEKKIDFSDVSCGDVSHAVLRPITSDPECGNGRRYEIGYDLGEAGFLRDIDLCHYEAEARTLWSHSTIEPNNLPVNRNVAPRSAFKTGLLYQDVDVRKAYKLKAAYETVDSILGGHGRVDKYLSIDTHDTKFFAKGHLIARADKIYRSEQESTMFYANVVPMWQQINGHPGNWLLVEDYVRDLAHQKNRKLDVWVGGIGVLELEDKRIYLAGDEQDMVPVPKVLFKCVVDKSARQALCFLVVNNPYVETEDELEDYRVCKKLDACDNISVDFDELSKGYLYCCGLGDFYENNHKELGLGDELGNYVDYDKLELFTNNKRHEPIEWSDGDLKSGHRHRKPNRRGGS